MVVRSKPPLARVSWGRVYRGITSSSISSLSSWGRCSNGKVGSFGTDTEAVLVRQGMGGGVLIRTKFYYSLPHPSMHRLTSGHRFAGIEL